MRDPARDPAKISIWQKKKTNFFVFFFFTKIFQDRLVALLKLLFFSFSFSFLLLFFFAKLLEQRLQGFWGL